MDPPAGLGTDAEPAQVAGEAVGSPGELGEREGEPPWSDHGGGLRRPGRTLREQVADRNPGRPRHGGVVEGHEQLPALGLGEDVDLADRRHPGGGGPGEHALQAVEEALGLPTVVAGGVVVEVEADLRAVFEDGEPQAEAAEPREARP